MKAVGHFLNSYSWKWQCFFMKWDSIYPLFSKTCQLTIKTNRKSKFLPTLNSFKKMVFKNPFWVVNQTNPEFIICYNQEKRNKGYWPQIYLKYWILGLLVRHHKHIVLPTCKRSTLVEIKFRTWTAMTPKVLVHLFVNQGFHVARIFIF